MLKCMGCYFVLWFFLMGLLGNIFFCKGEISFLVLLHVPSLHLYADMELGDGCVGGMGGVDVF